MGIGQAEITGWGVPRTEKSKQKGMRRDGIHIWRTASRAVQQKHTMRGEKEAREGWRGRRQSGESWDGPGESVLDSADKRRKRCCSCFEFLMTKIVYIQIKSIWKTNKM